MAMYGEDLAHQLQKTHATNPKNQICSILAMWVMDPHERDAVVARDAIEQGDTMHKALIEIYIGRKSSQLLLTQQAYNAKFKSHLDQDISITEPPTPYQRILVALATSHKSHHADISQHVAKCDAKRLFEAGEGSIGAIDESIVLEILTKRSIPQLKLTLSCYKHIYGHDYVKSLKKETSGEFEDSLRAAMKCMYTPSKYYAKVLYTCIKGTMTDKSSLARVMVSRAEIDMDEIQSVFHGKYGLKLEDAICESIPKGDYRDFLLALATKV
ncbi:annexin D8-like isoform X2 [Magnolia sinica]|nr:annexin D8-like isoform X2 [Magnolia sinica]